MSRILTTLFELTLVSTAFSGARRAGQLDFNYQQIDNETVRTVVESYFKVGDYVVDFSVNQMRKYPTWFPRSG
ncbi:uncharacterized protein BJ171DRAFT_539071 [Polychytrium aggregatum]|uniref:uncharacterized protein n=1 Tax=Polychytrium aggregatum TaxID=110093 RepID=UPI0022FE0B78|nr:uncharacterized protein BJ171DRAFT_539071 [Polychytrium aggregatum]KAI9190835.1 hypothetical protein BJ171DRAFT_539071 [Polychytrium aggregatum]